MSNLVVLVFDEQDEAAKVRKTLGSVKDTGRLNLDDSAVVEKIRTAKCTSKMSWIAASK